MALLLILICVVFFPPVIVYLSMQAAVRMKTFEQDLERQKRIDSDLAGLEMSYTGYSNIQMQMEHLVKRLDYEKDNEGLVLYQKACDKNADMYFAGLAEKISNNLAYPCEFAFVFKPDENSREIRLFRHGHNLGIEKVINTNLNNSPLWARYLAATLDDSADELIYRNSFSLRIDDKFLMLFATSLTNEIKLYALSDLNSITPEKSLKKQIKDFKQSDYGIGCWFSNNHKPVFSDYFADKSELKHKIINFINTAGNNPEIAFLGGFRLSISAIDTRKGRRLFAVTAPIVSAPGSKRRQNIILLMLIAGLSAIIFIVITQKIVLDRGMDLPIRYLIPTVFLILFIQPIFSMLYLANEYLQMSYNNSRSTSTEKLENDLRNLDYITNDKFLEKINLARSFDSIEKIASFTETAYEPAKDFEFCLNLLNKLSDKLKNQYFSSLWICRKDGDFVALSLRADKEYHPEKSERDFTGFFNNRFMEILDYKNNNHILPAAKNSDNIEGELKGEYSRDFFLQIFGPDAFFKFRRYSPLLLDISSSYKKNKLIGHPIYYKDSYYAYLTWHTGEDDARNNFPDRMLTLHSKSPRLAVYGSERKVDSLLFSITETESANPELFDIAKTAHIHRSQASSI